MKYRFYVVEMQGKYIAAAPYEVAEGGEYHGLPKKEFIGDATRESRIQAYENVNHISTIAHPRGLEELIPLLVAHGYKLAKEPVPSRP
ncbi:MAG: hypothetical protein EPN86_05135 [Nanoarchaeota archaeon]|nr:MAG: hypothetical protein EPN86_05135 [Nanoarchaeota archaeon]